LVLPESKESTSQAERKETDASPKEIISMNGQPVNFISSDEIWKPIPHKECHAQFYASSLGRVKKTFTNKKNQVIEYLIEPQECTDGRLKASLSLGKKLFDRASTYVSRLVLMSFKPCSQMSNLFIVHKDHNYSNNNLENLAWADREEYYYHQGRNPFRPRVAASPYVDPASGEIKTRFTKVPVSTIRSILEDFEGGLYQIDIAGKYKLSQAYISLVVRGKRRSQQTDIIPRKTARIKKTSRLNESGVMDHNLLYHDKRKPTR